VHFDLGPVALRLTDENMARVVEPGLFDVLIGTSSAKLSTFTLEVANN
jgi:hypothetical protein